MPNESRDDQSIRLSAGLGNLPEAPSLPMRTTWGGFTEAEHAWIDEQTRMREAADERRRVSENLDRITNPFINNHADYSIAVEVSDPPIEHVEPDYAPMNLTFDSGDLTEAMRAVGIAANVAGNTMRECFLNTSSRKRLRYSQKLKGALASLLVENQVTAFISLDMGRTQSNTYYIKALINGWEFFGIFDDRPNHKSVASFIGKSFINTFDSGCNFDNVYTEEV